MNIENRMVVDAEWKDYKKSKDESYYEDMPDWMDERDDDDE